MAISRYINFKLFVEFFWSIVVMKIKEELSNDVHGKDKKVTVAETPYIVYSVPIYGKRTYQIVLFSFYMA